MIKAIGYVVKAFILTIIFFAAMIIPTMIIPVAPEITSRMTAGFEKSIMTSMVLVCLLGAIILLTVVRMSKWSGLKLIFTLSLSFWGLIYFMGQIESFYFRYAFEFLTIAEMINIALRGMMTTLIVIPTAILISGKIKKKEEVHEALEFADKTSILKKAILFSIIYITVYFLFGHFVAWQFESVRVFYSGSTENLGFINQVWKTISERPSFIPYQFVRGLLWIVFSTPVILMMSGSRFKTMVSLSLLFSFHGFQIIMSQIIFPPDVVIAHTIETTASAVIYGLILGYMFYIPKARIGKTK